MNIDSYFSENLAGMRLKLAEAAQRHEIAQADADELRNRIIASEQRREAITAARLNGTSNAEEANEFVALGGDLEVLREMHAESKAAAIKLDPTTERQQVAQAEKDLREHVNAASYEALFSRTREIEALLLKSLAATFTAGKAVGKRTVGDAFSLTPALRSVITHNHLPGV
ncbi:MAG: hypothetical protein ABL923_06705 [Burkholderiaceae bacterium]